MKEIATNVFSFENLISDGYVYADKTKHLHQLINKTQGSQFFLSRPRRFGKSLLLSTIQCIFEGKRELFKGLYIDSIDYDWQTYPVIRLDMNNTAADSVEKMERDVKKQLKWNYIYYDIEINMRDSAKGQFEDLIRLLAQKSPHKQVVLLIDEYDKPILDHLGTKEVLLYQRFLKQFYGVVKSTEALQRFCLMTGVSKFSKVSIFSDLNNLKDITMSKQFSDICGFTHEELLTNFYEHIQILAKDNDMTKEEAIESLRKMYDGYLFCAKGKRMYNPVSVGNCLTDKEFGKYWFETGTLSGLINYLKITPVDLANCIISIEDLGTYDPENPGLIPILFQTGYLTIKDVSGYPPSQLYTLDFPNTEVKSGFNRWLMKVYTGKDSFESKISSTLAAQCLRALELAEVDEFIDIINEMFAGIPYELLDNNNEHQYHCLFHAMLNITGSNICSEVQTNLGRIDSVIETVENIYVIEAKYEKSAQKALEQIKSKKYYEPYVRQGKKLILLGINFSQDTRNINEYAFEKIDI